MYSLILGLDVNHLRSGPYQSYRSVTQFHSVQGSKKNCFWWACYSGHAHIVRYLVTETQVDTTGTAAFYPANEDYTRKYNVLLEAATGNHANASLCLGRDWGLA